jgi:ABC-type nitrate/sulfonate/bicarbonate transport system permease component
MFAALFLIALSGVLLYLLMVALNNALLGHWHESTLREEL